jgi:hypothetical protein
VIGLRVIWQESWIDQWKRVVTVAIENLNPIREAGRSFDNPRVGPLDEVSH